MENTEAKICVPVCVRRADELADTARRAAHVADLVEIRFDCLDENQLVDATREYAQLRKSVGCPFIVTFRPMEEGGYRSISLDERLEFWNQCADLWSRDETRTADLADVEFQLLIDPAWKHQIADERIICSHHELAPIPKDPGELYSRMLASGILKIAVQASDAVDCIPIFNLLDRAQREGREVIAVAMGEAGVMTRILGPSRGSFLTYGSFDENSATAPGQLTARELREIYRIDNINQDTEIMGVIGQPVAHSISPHIHNAAFAKANINAVFIPFEVHDLDAFMRRMVRQSSREIDWNLRGLSVTAPHKTSVLKHLDWIDPVAKEIWAVNTIVAQDGALHGYNTDAAGFIAPLKRRIEFSPGIRCAVIGAGGAARAVVWALQQHGGTVSLFTRNAERAKAFRDQFEVDCLSLTDAAFDGFDMVINTTPVGTRGKAETETPVTASQLRGVRLAYDLVYNPLETRFLREARDAGCETIGGLEMLIGQAVEQFKLWTGKQPDEEAMHAAATHALQKSEGIN